MYSQTFIGLKKSLVVVVMVAMLTFSAPKKSEAVLLLLLAPATVGATVLVIVTELIIYCAVGLICGGGNGGGSGSGGGSSSSSSSSGSSSGDGDVSAFEGDECNSLNYCDQIGLGTVQSDGFCTATPPPNSECTNGEFPEDALTINPDLVRVGNDVVISYDVGEFNYPPNCTLSGASPVGVMSLTTQTGTVNVTALGPNFFTLACGTENAEAKINITGTVQEI